MLHIVMNIEYVNYIKKDKLLLSISKERKNEKNKTLNINFISIKQYLFSK